jgi:hypothetical protein
MHKVNRDVGKELSRPFEARLQPQNQPSGGCFFVHCLVVSCRLHAGGCTACQPLLDVSVFRIICKYHPQGETWYYGGTGRFADTEQFLRKF